MSESTNANTAGAGEQNNEQQPQDGGSKFEAITSQEALDRIVSQRVARERNRYADYDDLKAKAAKFDEVQEASKTAEQKAAERLAALEKENAGLKASQLRADVAVEKGLPAKLAKFLQGSTREELEASAAELLELNKPAGPVIRGQEKSPGKVGEDPLREFTRSLFSSTSD